MSELYYAGLIGIRDEAFVEAASALDATDYKATMAIANPHMTLLLPSQLKAVKDTHGFSNKEAKTFVKEIIHDVNAQHTPPDVDTSLLVQRAERENHYLQDDELIEHYKHTYFLRVINQDEWQDYLNVLTDALGIERVERYFHVSIANNTGEATFSIADICADDCVGVGA